MDNQEQLYKLLFDQASEGLIVSDESGIIEIVNAGALKQFGYSEVSELAGNSIDVLIPPRFRSKHHGHHSGYMKSPHNRKMGGGQVLYGIRKDGSEFPVEIGLSTFLDGQGKRKAFALVTDITERHRIAEINSSLERERELNNLKSRFVTIVSHEFRTPLSAINSSAQLIEKYTTSDTNEQRVKHTHRIQDSVSHLNGMIEDILSLSKIEEGKIEVKSEKFNLDEVISEVLSEYAELYPGPSFEWKPATSVIESDRKLVGHILQNIISNAFKYTPDGKGITVDVTPHLGDYVITVTDSGVGIPDSEQSKLFERFYRASNVANIKGTGLGLHIVAKYLDLLAGKIKFTSEVNKGSQFTVTLPKNAKI